MEMMFDIFVKQPDGQPMWLKAVEGLEEATAELDCLAATGSGEFFIYSVRKRCVVKEAVGGRV